MRWFAYHAAPVFVSVCLAGAFSACGGLKLDINSNCLNERSNCFRPDVTTPQITGHTPNGTVSQLTQVTVTFSEEMKDATEIAKWELTGSGKNTLAIQSIAKQEGSHTYVMTLTGLPASGAIEFTTAARDYAGKQVTNPNFTITGNVSISITATPALSHVTSLAGTGHKLSQIIAVTHSYDQDTPDNRNTWKAYLDQPACSGTPVAGGTGNIAAGATENLTVNTGASDASQTDQIVTLATTGQHQIRICYENLSRNKAGEAVVTVTRDDSYPAAWANPAGGNFGQVGSITLFCDDNCLKIAFTTDGSAPVIDATGTVTNGLEYGATFPMPYTTDPTVTAVRFVAMDRAGKLSPAINHSFTVDTRIPQITVGANPFSYLTSGATPSASPVNNFHTTSNVNWSTNLSSRSEFIVAANCGTATWGAAPSTNNTSAVAVGSLAVGSNAVTLCARESTTNTHIGSSTLTFFRDDTDPVFAGIASAAAESTTSARLTWLAASDASSVEYLICQTNTPGGCNGASFVATYGADGSITANNYLVTGLSTAQDYYFVVQARDAAGRATANNVEQKWTAPFLYIQLTGLTGASVTVTRTATAGNENLVMTANGTHKFPSVMTLNDTFTISVAGQAASNEVCSFTENPWGQIQGITTTRRLHCAAGYLVGGSLRAVPAAPLNFSYLRGKKYAFAGNGTGGNSVDGTAATAANISRPDGMAVSGNMLYFVAEYGVIRAVNLTTGNLATIAGTYSASCPGSPAPFVSPMGLATDGTNLFVSDHSLHKIFRIRLSDNAVDWLAGDGSDSNGNCTLYGGGFKDDTNPRTAKFDAPSAMVLYNNSLYVADYQNHNLRRINLASGEVTTVVGSNAATPVAGCTNGTGNSALLTSPAGLAVNQSTGVIYIADEACRTVQAFNTSTGQVTTLAGTLSTAGFQDGALAGSKFNQPFSLLFDGVNNLYVGEYTAGRRIRKIDLHLSRISTIAGPGSGSITDTNIGGKNIFAGIRTLISNGSSLFAADSANNRIYRIADLGLVGYWPLRGTPNDHGSDQAVKHDGTVINGPTIADGRFGEANGSYRFNGVDQRISITDHAELKPTNSFTLAAWVYMDNWNLCRTQTMGIVSNTESSGFGFWCNETAAPGALAFYVRTSAGAYTMVQFTPPTELNRWHHISGTVQGQRITLFWDGKPVSQANFGSVISVVHTTTQALTIGADPIPVAPGAASFFQGRIADVRLYSRSLNEAEIAELAQQAAAAQVGESFNREPLGLIAGINFNEALLTDRGGMLDDVVAGGSVSGNAGLDGDTGGSKYFNGTTYYVHPVATVSVPELPAKDHPRSLCAWVNPYLLPTAAPAANQYMTLVSYGPDSPNRKFGLFLFNDAGTHYLVVAGADNDVRYPFVMPLNAWSHVCTTFDGSNARVYVNGTALTGAVTSGTGSTLWDTNPNNFRIARNSGLSNDYFFNGSVDEVRLYDNALTAQQVRSISTHVPAGLVARFDFAGSGADTVGLNTDLTAVNSPTYGDDRFYQGSSSMSLATSASQYAQTNIGKFSPSTGMSAALWIYPNTNWGTTNAANHVHLLNQWGVSGAGNASWALALDDSAQPVAMLHNGSTSTVISPTLTLPANTWHHLAMTYSSAGGLILYLNGMNIGSAAAVVPQLSNYPVRIGAEAGASAGFFYGHVDDARIYNRQLTAAEVRALVFQPNKRIFLTNNAYTGNLLGNGGVFGAPGGSSGIQGADAKCMWASEAARPATGRYKAFVVGTAERLACAATANCTNVLENRDWIMKPRVQYTAVNRETKIGITNDAGIFPFGTLSNALDAGAIEYRTGMTATWQTMAGCYNAGIAFVDDNALTNGSYGVANQTGSGFISSSFSSCDTARRILCVEQ